MARVVVRFFDDETVEGTARDLDFDEPDFLVEVDDAGGLENNETAWIPLTAVKWVELQRDKELADSPIRKLGIPFSAVKALFFVREFDARGDEAGTASDAYLARRTMAPLLDVLEEMDMLTRLHRDGLLSDNEYASKRTLVLERL